MVRGIIRLEFVKLLARGCWEDKAAHIRSIDFTLTFDPLSP